MVYQNKLTHFLPSMTKITDFIRIKKSRLPDRSREVERQEIRAIQKNGAGEITEEKNAISALESGYHLVWRYQPGCNARIFGWTRNQGMSWGFGGSFPKEDNIRWRILDSISAAGRLKTNIISPNSIMERAFAVFSVSVYPDCHYYSRYGQFLILS
mgnify:CR=1 FL=1